MKEEAGPVVDAFETAYTLLRFPEYWAAGLVQTLVFVLGPRLGGMSWLARMGGPP